MINKVLISRDSGLKKLKDYFSQFIFNIHKLMILFRESDLKKYRDRINPYFYLKLVFKPSITHIDDNNEKQIDKSIINPRPSSLGEKSLSYKNLGTRKNSFSTARILLPVRLRKDFRNKYHQSSYFSTYYCKPGKKDSVKIKELLEESMPDYIERPRDPDNNYITNGPTTTLTDSCGIELEKNTNSEDDSFNSNVLSREVVGDKEFDKNIKSNSGLAMLIFNKLEYILNREPLNNLTQLKIEKFVYTQASEFFQLKKEQPFTLGVNSNLFTSKFNELCVNKVQDFEVYLDNLRVNLNFAKDNKTIEEMKKPQIIDYYVKIVLNDLSNIEITNFMLYIFCLIVTHNDLKVENEADTPVSLLNNALKLGKFLTSRYIIQVYKQYIKKNKAALVNRHGHITFSEFKKDFLQSSMNNILINDEFILKLGSLCIEIMVTCSLLSMKVIKEKPKHNKVILEISEEVKSTLDRHNPVLVTPLNLPMIVKPKPYSKNELGGYLLNDIEYDRSLIVDKLSYKIPSRIDKDNIIYKTINNMMATPFKINKYLLEFLLNQNNIHNLLIEKDSVHKFENIIKRTPSQEKEYQEYLSKKILQEYIIEIAKAYSNVPQIYFPIKLDNRGRLYPIPAYLNYQGSELAQSLLLFAHPDTILRSDSIAIEYLKSYGAVCYGNGLSRKSYTDRLN
jgi:hypothetical protein